MRVADPVSAGALNTSHGHALKVVRKVESSDSGRGPR